MSGEPEPERLLSAVSVSGAVAPGSAVPASALFMKERSAKYKAAQAAGTLNDKSGNDFHEAICTPEASASTLPQAKSACCGIHLRNDCEHQCHAVCCGCVRSAARRDRQQQAMG